MGFEIPPPEAPRDNGFTLFIPPPGVQMKVFVPVSELPEYVL
jgi:hypothetical protein